MDMVGGTICPPIPSTTRSTSSRPTPIPDDDICESVTWNQKGATVAGGNGQGSELNQLVIPYGLFIDDNDIIYVADTYNHRVTKLMPGTSNVVVVAGGNGQGDRSDQLNAVSSVVVDKNGTIFICDYQNRRVQQWFRDDNQGQTIISDITCFGLAMDNEGALYVSD
ncbi:unnamed protein product [Rotaria sp. Silwood1]|nr:unnamed protein product [Rotaria sp. Silwood1]